MTRTRIDPALGLYLPAVRTLEPQTGSLSVIIPAHNEGETIAEVVTEALGAVESLQISGEVLVSASACTDDTAALAKAAGARVIESPIGKGAAVVAGLTATSGDIVCLVDGDVKYLGEKPLVTLLLEPILHGIADACVTDLYWRPLYPQLWQYAFFAPLAGVIFPEMLAKVGSTPWSGQRAALRHLWPESLPSDFTVDLALLLHWNNQALRLRPVLADDWVNPQRPKPDLMQLELGVILDAAIEQGRISADDLPSFNAWFETVHEIMSRYRPDEDDPQLFEASVLRRSVLELRSQLAKGR